MQVMKLKAGMKPLTIITSIALSSPLLYSSVDQSSRIVSVMTNPASNAYMKVVDNIEDALPFVKLRFMSYLDAWRKKTIFQSSTSTIVNDDNFQAIVAMGFVAVPLIIDEISKKPSTLVWALNYIYGHKISNREGLTIMDACKLWVKALKK